MKNIMILILSAMLFTVVCGGTFSGKENTVKFRQPDGSEVELHKNPQRTVICFASGVQIWYAAGGSAIGIPKVKSQKTLPEAARQLPQIGAVTVPNPEKVLALKPDLVILNYKLERHRALAGLLRQNQVEAVCVNCKNYTDFADLLDFFCRLNGGSIKQNTEAERISTEVNAWCKKAGRQQPVSVAIIFAAVAGFSLESSISNAGTMVKMLGAKNILKDNSSVRRDFSYEQLLLADPDVILVVTMGEAAALKKKFRKDLMSQPVWGELKASKNNRVHFLPADLFLYQPGGRYPEAFRYLYYLLYPEKKTDGKK